MRMMGGAGCTLVCGKDSLAWWRTIEDQRVIEERQGRFFTAHPRGLYLLHGRVARCLRAEPNVHLPGPVSALANTEQASKNKRDTFFALVRVNPRRLWCAGPGNPSHSTENLTTMFGGLELSTPSFDGAPAGEEVLLLSWGVTRNPPLNASVILQKTAETTGRLVESDESRSVVWGEGWEKTSSATFLRARPPV